jgi:hypothetical protein
MPTLPVGKPLRSTAIRAHALPSRTAITEPQSVKARIVAETLLARHRDATRNADVGSVQRTRQECGMPHVVISEIGAAIDIQAGAVVSRVV